MSRREGGAEGPLNQQGDIFVNVAGPLPINEGLEDHVVCQSAEEQGDDHVQSVPAGAGIENQKAGEDCPDQAAVAHHGKGQHGDTQPFGLIALNGEQQRFIETPQF